MATIRLFKLNFKRGEGTQKQMIIEAKKYNNMLVIQHHSRKNGRCNAIIKEDKLIPLLQTNKYLYECLFKYPVKAFFDLDLILKEGYNIILEEFIKRVKEIILSIFDKEDEFAISGSITDIKLSLHITLNKYVIRNEDDRDAMKIICKYFNNVMNEKYNYDECFDTRVYTKNRLMKLINQSKIDGRVQEIIENQDYKKHIISSFFNENCLSIPTDKNYEVYLNIEICKSNKNFDLSLLPKVSITTPKNIDYLSLTPKQVLDLLPISKKYDHNYTHLVARFCFNNDLSFEEYISWYIKKNNTEEAKQKWIKKWSELNKFPSVSIEKMKKILNHFYPDIKKNIYEKSFIKSFVKEKEFITKIDRLDQNHFEIDKKFIICGIGMGGGKSTQTLQYIKNCTEVLFITPNISLANNIYKRVVDEFKYDDFIYYQKISTKLKKEGKLNEIDKLIICLNSIHYLNRDYKTIVIDEIETLLFNFAGNFLNEREYGLKKKVWNIFLNLIANAEKVILLDAFITTKTINFVKRFYPFGEGEKNMVYYERKNEPVVREVFEYNQYELMFKKIIEDLKLGKKLFIFYPRKKNSPNGNELSMESVANCIANQTGKSGTYYHADVDDVIKQEIANSNETWINKDFIITNNIITCGVNFEKDHFHKKYIFMEDFNKSRDIAQISARARIILEKQINICFLQKRSSKVVLQNDCYEMNCPIYKELYENNYNELMCPSKIAVKKFFKQAHYEYNIDKEKLDEEICCEMQILLKEHQIFCKYENIDEITKGRARDIEERAILNQQTSIDKQELLKYYFNNKFIEDELILSKGYSIEQIEMSKAEIFECFINIIDKVKFVKNNPNYIFNKLNKHYDTEKLIPTIEMIQKKKLTKELLDEIFVLFKFKNLSKASTSIKIIKNIYNEYYGYNLINSYYNKDGGDHSTSYHINKLFEDVEEFIIDNIKY